jgi:hypothetical protein
LILAVLPLQVGLSSIESLSYLLHLVGAIFSALLFGLSLYAWSRRRNRSLLFVAAAFLVFFIAILLDEVIPVGPTSELLSAVLDLAILALFFLTIVVGLQRETTARRTNGGLQ